MQNIERPLPINHPSLPPYDPLWKIKQASGYLNVSEKRIYDLFKEGLLTKIKVGTRDTRIRFSEIEKLIADWQSLPDEPSIMVAQKLAVESLAKKREAKKAAEGSS
jgi:excisionase family DNA binding protein